MKLVVDGDRFVPGDRVRGHVLVEKGGLQEIRVGLLFREESEGIEETVSQVLAKQFEGSGDIPAGAKLPFLIVVPPDAAPSVRTRHGGLFWEIVARTDHVSADRVKSRRVEITPAN